MAKTKNTRRKSKRPHGSKSVHKSTPLAPPIEVNYYRLVFSDYYALFAGGRPRLRNFFFSIDSIGFYLILIVGLSHNFFKIPDYANVPRWPRIIIGSGLIGAGMSRSLTFIRLLLNAKRAKTDPRYILSFLFVNFLCDVTSGTLLIVWCFYHFGIISFVAAAVQTYWPTISHSVSSGIATGFGWVMSGIIGNASFALIKWWYVKFREGRDSKVKAKPGKARYLRRA